MGIYDERPWLARYGDGRPAELENEHPSALAMFTETARRAPGRPALLYFDAELSFGELDALSDALAAALAARGIRAGDRVALMLQNVPQFPIALLAAWKAGAIAVPVNPMLKGRELEGLLRDSGAAALVALEGLWHEVAAEVVARTDVRVVLTTSELDLLGGERPGPLRAVQRRPDPDVEDLLAVASAHAGERPPAVPAPGPDDVALLSYTSGTTGPPKGAMNTHGNLVFTAQVYRDWVGIDERDVVLALAPLFHITGMVGHLALSLLTGAPMVLAYRFDAETTLELIERRRATFTIAAVTAFIALMHAEGAARRDVSSLRKVYSGGAPVSPATAQAFEERFGAPLHVAYGLTETTSPAHAIPFGTRAPVDHDSGALSIGLPVFGTLARVVDDEGREVAPGELGEIVISGPQIVPGYWNKPQESEHAIPGGELHTGDVGKMDEQGWFYLLDRRKDMIIAAGYKVWPREVEDVLAGHPAVREAAVVGVPDAYRGETVRAFVALKPQASAEPDELIAFCRERMAAYKYPRAVEIVDELPHTASGKVMRRVLREEAAR